MQRSTSVLAVVCVLAALGGGVAATAVAPRPTPSSAQVAFNSGMLSAGTALRFLGSGVLTPIEALVVFPMTTDFLLTRLFVGTTGVAPTAGNSCLFTVRKNGVNTALSATIHAGDTKAHSAGVVVSGVAGDVLSISVKPTATMGASLYAAFQYSVRFRG